MPPSPTPPSMLPIPIQQPDSPAAYSETAKDSSLSDLGRSSPPAFSPLQAIFDAETAAEQQADHLTDISSDFTQIGDPEDTAFELELPLLQLRRVSLEDTLIDSTLAHPSEESSSSESQQEVQGLESVLPITTSATSSPSELEGSRPMATDMASATLPVAVISHILGYLSPSDLSAFSRTSKQKYEMTLPVLYAHIKLPLISEPKEHGLKKRINIAAFVRTVTIDLSNEKYMAFTFGCDHYTRKMLHQFSHLRHLIVLRTNYHASVGVLGSLVRYLVEQDSLQELTWDINVDADDFAITSFKEKCAQAWKNVHRGAFHSNPRSLNKLNVTMKNRHGRPDGLSELVQLMECLMPTVETMCFDFKDTVHGMQYQLVKAPDYLRYFGNKKFHANIKSLEVVYTNAVPRPILDIANYFPDLEKLKITLLDASLTRRLTELNTIRPLTKLREWDMTWTYEVANPHETGLYGMYNKAKEKAKEALTSVLDVKEEKIRSGALKQARSLAISHRLTDLRSVTWRYTLEPGMPEKTLKVALSWDGTTFTAAEV